MMETATNNTYTLDRRAGILLHPTSLPSPYGIGDLGKEAYRFVDFLQSAGQRLWQILPLSHTGFGDSPYQSYSAFAGQPLLISPDHLISMGLLTEDDCKDMPEVADPEHVDYGQVISWKYELFRLATERFLKMGDANLRREFDDFYLQNIHWLADYSLFMACKDANDGCCWQEWPSEYKRPSTTDKERFRKELWREIAYYEFMQFIVYKEWMALKAYANERDIQIIGDIPIFISMDSADVWSHQELFQLTEEGYPIAVSGVPPDYFSSTGQLWGNPLYDWEAHEKDGFHWWISRIQNQLVLFDTIRIDHFRGFESNWAVPYGEETAINGSWKAGPGMKLFHAIQAALGDGLPIIAEDLGVITPEVEALRDACQFPGMKILQFAFDSGADNSYLPHMYHTSNCICYTGTHDNDTTVGWWMSTTESIQKKILNYMHTDGKKIHMDFIRTCLASTAAYAIYPLQDVLGLDTRARLNVPGCPTGNWAWRFTEEVLTDELAKELEELTLLYGRNL